MKTDKKKYIIVLLITIGIFIVVFMLVNFLNSKKVDNIDRLQRKITVDLLATETQFALLKNTPCKNINNSILTKELGELGDKLVFMEKNQGSGNKDVLQLKKYYSLLQVKDHLLMQELAGKCDIQTDSIVYFYEQECDDCLKQGLILTELKKEYPWLRIYSFDRNLDFSIIDTFEGLYDLGDVYPVLIIDEEMHEGFKTIEDIEGFIPELQEQKEIEINLLAGEEFITDRLDYIDYSGYLYLKEYENGIYIYKYGIEVGDGHGSYMEEVKLEYSKEKGDFMIISHYSEEDGVGNGKYKNTQ